MIYSDEFAIYDPLPGMSYQHKRVHHAAKVYVSGDVHTNTIEGFWSLVKCGVSGVYLAMSEEYLQSYLNEYSFRYNHRIEDTPMFLSFLNQIYITEAN
jgi:hypothetical protein